MMSTVQRKEVAYRDKRSHVKKKEICKSWHSIIERARNDLIKGGPFEVISFKKKKKVGPFGKEKRIIMIQSIEEPNEFLILKCNV